MRWTPIVLATACTVSGKPFSPFGDRNEAASPAGGAPTSGGRFTAHCPNGKKYALGALEVLPGHGVESVAIADVNGDGKLDIITGNPHGTRPAKPHLGNIGVMLGKGNGTFDVMKLMPIGVEDTGAPARIAIADLNGDKRPDIVFADPGFISSTPAYALGNGDGTFQENVSLRSHDTLGQPLVADLNGDGKPDIVVREQLWLNGGGKFPGHVNYEKEYLEASALGDFDGDGSLDITAVAEARGAMVYLNDGNANFSAGTKIEVPDAKFVTVGDFNGDHKMDLAIVSPQSVALVMAQGGGAFRAPIYFKVPESDHPGGVFVADLDGNGKADVVVVDDDNLLVYMNDGNGALAEPIRLAVPKPFLIAAGDFTGEHVQSLVVTDDSESSDEDKSHVYVFHASCK